MRGATYMNKDVDHDLVEGLYISEVRPMLNSFFKSGFPIPELVETFNRGLEYIEQSQADGRTQEKIALINEHDTKGNHKIKLKIIN